MHSGDLSGPYYFENQGLVHFGNNSPAFHYKSALVPHLRAFHFNQVYKQWTVLTNLHNRSRT